jgi:predicted nucleic acid-binding protein
MILLDTNVVSEMMRPVADPSVMRWLSMCSANDLYCNAVVVAEILYGVELLPRGKRKTDLLAGAERLFKVVLGGRILPFDEQAARQFSRIAAGRRSRGKPMTELDAQIAAIAQVHDASLATRNTPDFEGCGVQLINPWLD